ncbi:hypothetical protein L1887_42502 [Cichorium endivia]|nr:hypothetical protein L1887_42502 [Cichorium endivia]
MVSATPDNRSNSRANTCNKPRLLEGMHLLDKRSTRALPVAAMIHDNSNGSHGPRAGDASFKFPALSTFDVQSKSLNEDPLEGKSGASSRGNSSSNSVCTGLLVPSVGDAAPGLNWPGRASGAVTLKKIRVLKASLRSNESWGLEGRSDTVLVSTINDADQGSADVAFRTPLAPYEKSKFLGSGGSMVARLKLKGIDGRAPPGVEPAA